MSNQLYPVPRNFEWPRCPSVSWEVERLLRKFLICHPFAECLEKKILSVAGVRLFDIVDHVVVAPDSNEASRLKSSYDMVGGHRYEFDIKNDRMYHPYAALPTIHLSDVSIPQVAIKVDSIESFLAAHNLKGCKIEGIIFSHYRRAKIVENNTTLLVVERRGYTGYEPARSSSNIIGKYRKIKNAWRNRSRHFATKSEGLDETLKLTQQLVADYSVDFVADIAMECERAYWQRSNTAAKIQKKMQDRVGIGWANHDHHTFRSSRAHFKKLLKIFETLGFKFRERYYAGETAGWGAQILENPMCGIVIFADLDLFPDEYSIDFSKENLEPRLPPGTVGSWCALHGESILKSGMHHLECKFRFHLVGELLKSVGIQMMKPFSNFPYLMQGFTQGEMWFVNQWHLSQLVSKGIIDQETAKQIELNKYRAIGSHLERLQRENGYKGFNQLSVDIAITDTNPKNQPISE